VSNFIAVAYYTAGTGYEAEAQKLVASCLKHGVTYHVEAVPNLGSWQKNTHYKARFILDMLDLHAKSGDLRPIVCVDADAQFHAYPLLFDSLDCDAAFAYRDYSKFPSVSSRHRKELLSGTVYFANNERARELVRAWIAENAKNQVVWEQKNLQAVVERMRSVVRMEELPPSYCKIFDIMRGVGPAVIEHYQKSRIYRRQIDGRHLYPAFRNKQAIKTMLRTSEIR
jgi:hypothetical protein